MKILVTGGAGFIGSALVNKLIKKGHEVCVYDSFLEFIDKPKYFETALAHRKLLYKEQPQMVINKDIRDFESLKNACAIFKPEIIVHLAGLPMARPLPKYADQMIPINMDGTFKVLQAFEECESARRLIYTSSSMTYGHFTKVPQPEDVVLHPINAYGATKAAGEYFVKLSKKEWTIVRPTSVYGYTDAANRVTQLLLDAAITGKSAWVVRGELLDFTYIDDVAEGFLRCIESHSALYLTLNISRGEPRPSTDFAEILKSYFPDFSYEVREPASTQVFRGALDIFKARTLLGYEPKYSIEDGIKEILDLAEQYNWKQQAYETVA